MYTSRDPRAHHEAYFTLVARIVQAAPSAWPMSGTVNNQF